MSSVSYSWIFGNSQTSNQLSPVISYSLAGAYTVTLIATGINSCVDSVKNNITISTKPQPDFNISTNLACTGSLVAFNDISNSGTDSIIYRKWDFGDNSANDSIAQVSHIYTLPGSYVISLTIATPTFCDTTIQKTITIVESPTAAFSVTNNCFGTPVNFINTTIPAKVVSPNDQ